MTHRSSPDLIQSVLQEQVSILSVSTCAQITGRSEHMIYKAQNPNSGITLRPDELAALDAGVARLRRDAAGTPFLRWVARRVTLLADIGQSGADLGLEALDVAQADGVVAANIRSAIDPAGPGGREITPGERDNIKRSVDRAQKELTDVARIVSAERTAPFNMRKI